MTTYPRFNHYLIFNKMGRDEYHIKNFLTEEEWRVSAFYASFLKALDGETDPYDIYPDQIREDEVEFILEDFEQEGFLDDNKGIESLGIGSFIFPLWIPKVTKLHRFLGALWNKVLMMAWLPLLICGVHVLLSYEWEWIERGYGTVWGYFMGFGLGLLLHELSHAFACIGYSSKNRFFEMGLMMRHFLPGAYVIIDYSEMKNRFKRAQINAAGVECNVALCGMFLCCLKLGVFDSGSLLLAALLNLVLAVFNTTLIDGIDGMGIFREIFASSDDFVERAKKLAWDKNSKRALRRRGINGRATIAACYIIVLMQVLLPIVLLMNVLSIVRLFIV